MKFDRTLMVDNPTVEDLDALREHICQLPPVQFVAVIIDGTVAEYIRGEFAAIARRKAALESM